MCPSLLDTKQLWHWGWWKSGAANKRDPWHKPTCKCPLCRFEANGQLLYQTVGLNQVGCSCTWQRSLSLETPAHNQSWRVCNHRHQFGHTKGHILSRGPPTTCHHCGQMLTTNHMLLECEVLQESRDKYYPAGSLNTLIEVIPKTCRQWSDILYNSSLELSLNWCIFVFKNFN